MHPSNFASFNLVVMLQGDLIIKNLCISGSTSTGLWSFTTMQKKCRQSILKLCWNEKIDSGFREPRTRPTRGGSKFLWKNEVINVFGSPQPGQARKNLGIKRNKKLFTNLQTVINQDQKSLTLKVFSSYMEACNTKILVVLQLALLVLMLIH